MISKFTVGSFAVSLTSIMEALQEHQLLSFLLLYILHLFVSSLFMRYPVTRAPSKRPTPAPLRQWAEAQRNSSFTSF